MDKEKGRAVLDLKFCASLSDWKDVGFPGFLAGVVALGFTGITGYGEHLTAVNLTWILDLIAIGLIDERPKKGVVVYLWSHGN